jgi:choline dehydrogenase
VERYDVIVVGAGSAGCVLAARLSEDTDRQVLLLEAGEAPAGIGEYPAGLLDAGSILGADPVNPQNWAFDAELAPGRPYSIARGKILGGSSTINGAYFVRARKADFDRWSSGGNDEWTWERSLPYFRLLENDALYGDSSIHGGSGPITVWRPPQNHPITAAFAAAATELGFTEEPDKNAEGAPGVGPLPLDVVDGIRWNTGLAYLEPVLRRENLTVRGGVRVRRVLFDGSRVTGVELERDGVVSVVSADRVVLSAGSIMSPHLLMHSGIGPREVLDGLDIQVISALAGVGAAFTDHPQIAVGWTPARDVVDYGLGYTMASGLNFTSPDSPVAGDLEILPLLKPMHYLLSGQPGQDESLSMLVSVQHEESRGTMTPVSADPLVPPRIRYDYLSTAGDRMRMRYAVRTAVALLRSDGFAGLFVGFTGGLAAVVDDDRVLDGWIAANLGTSIHLCGTARFGPADDSGAVLDQYGSVYGVTGLTVADTSILPDAPTRGPAATAVLIGERVAAFLRSPLTP